MASLSYYLRAMIEAGHAQVSRFTIKHLRNWAVGFSSTPDFLFEPCKVV
jgi:hypothetical protein